MPDKPETSKTLSRADRRKQERAEQERRRAEIDRVLEEPRLPSFEAPASGKVVEPPKPLPLPKR